MFRVVIPARYGSTRLPGKPLRLLAGRPMIEHVHARALASGAAEVIVATDDERIAAACRAFGAEVAHTDPAHGSGTDRIAEVARTRGWAGRDIVVNVQGDEPLLPSAAIAQVARLLEQHAGAGIATLATPVTSREEFLDPHVVKVVCDARGYALYFSRAPIPWPRDHAPDGEAGAASYACARRHLGLYAYRVAALLKFAAAPAGRLEGLERLEQLRALERGGALAIVVADALERPGPGVDTESDLAVVAAIIGAR
jgi:3-deoxy-manno-octulosonate cytidylyltransferase (CMP-KDO synthetase)